MIAKAKAISHGINAIRYITGESLKKKHPEKIYRVLDNLMPSQPDTLGIWNSMQLTLSRFKPIKNSVIRIELSPSAEHTRFFDIEDWQKLWQDSLWSLTNKCLPARTEKFVPARPIWLTANTLFGYIRNPMAKFPTFTLQSAVWMKTETSTTTTIFIFVRSVLPSE